MAGTSAQDIWIPAVRPPHQSIGYALRRRWRWVVMVALVGLTVGASMAGRTELKYASRAKMRLLGERTAPVVDARLAHEDVSAIRAQYFVLRSPRILAGVVERLKLDTRWNTNADDAARRLAGMVEPRRLLDANLTEVKVTDADPQLAAAIANSIVDVYVVQANQPRLDQAQLTLQRLKEESAEQTKLLRQAEEQTLALRQDVGLNVGDGQFSMASLSGLRQVVVQAEAGLIEAKIRVETMNRSSSDALLALQTSSLHDRISQELATRLIQSETKLGELERRYGSGHPLVQAAEVERGQIVRACESQVVRLMELSQSEKSAAELRAGQARQRLADAASTLVAAGGAYGQLLAAQHNEETLRNLTRLLNDRAQRLEVEMSLSGPAADIIEPAVAATIPEMGTPLQVAMTAVGIGITLGLFFAVLLDRFDGRLRGAEEVEWQLSVPMLGAVAPTKSMLLPAKGGEAVETFRMIRNAIDFADHTLRTMCVTSAGAKEGTSTTVANLAWAWAEHGARVLVIDANLSEPSLHRLMGVSNEAGLSDHLSSPRNLDELVQQTKTTNVSLLPAGKMTGKATSAPSITPQGLSELLLWARSRADIILFDTAPLLRASDASIIARQADGTVLVARQQWTLARDLRRAIHLLSGGGEGLLGVVLSGASSSSSWDPMPLEEPAADVPETAMRRTAASRQRKRSRHAA